MAMMTILGLGKLEDINRGWGNIWIEALVNINGIYWQIIFLVRFKNDDPGNYFVVVSDGFLGLKKGE